MRSTVIVFFFLISFFGFSQGLKNPNSIHKTVEASKTIIIDSVSINPYVFKVMLKDSTVLSPSTYKVDFATSKLTFNTLIEADSIIINYLRYPDFLTKTYQQFDDAVIIEDNDEQNRIYTFKQSNIENPFTPLDGLTTSGSISRGVTIGNNQNSVLNSELDLQITGKLNETISLRASIQDANIPLQESGYSQRLDEFDQVFIELFSDRWNIRAGDIDLTNSDSYFSAFSKRVQGLSVVSKLGDDYNQTNIFASGALVRGQFTTYQFTAQEGNQGPYKLQGPNGELFVLIVSGSETVYVNGIVIKRGESEDYIIDYNAGEVIFNSTYPITSEMRISVDFQYSERDYSRVVAYAGGNHQTNKLKLGVSVYSENDSKNNPLQQNLSENQVTILSNAGDDSTLMTVPSEVLETFNENRILYKKEVIGGVAAFVFSNNPDDELYSVRFTLVGENKGNYNLTSTNAINNIYEYIAPISGVLQGNYEPKIQLSAPTQLQTVVLNGVYEPTEKTKMGFELAGSKNDLNLFSNLEDDNNKGFASKVTINQALIKKDSLWNLNAFIDSDFIQQDFRNIEGLYSPEFNRDWNLDFPQSNAITSDFGDQLLFSAGTGAFHHEKGTINYLFEHLTFSKKFNGNRHNFNTNLVFNEKLSIVTNTSFLNTDAFNTASTFLRSYNIAEYRLENKWFGARFSAEENKQREKATNALTTLSQRFSSYEGFVGLGDTTKVYAEAGYRFRVNDSLRANKLQKVNVSNTYYLDSRLIKNERTNLVLYVNYRTLNNEDELEVDEQSLNSRLQYSQKFLKNFIQWNTVFETNSGTLPQQDFTYVAVEAGQGAYTWIDYNANGIQELEEFEIAQFQDQGEYIRVLLPNQVFIKTHQNRLSQIVTLNPSNWINSKNTTKIFWPYFYNQTAYLIDRKIKREGNNFNINPFDTDENNQLGLQLNLRNVLFYNRGKQHYTTSYTYLNNEARNALSIGSISNLLKSHQLKFNHKFAKSWLINLESSFDSSKSTSENFASKNFNIDEARYSPKLSYLLNDNARFDIFYQFTNKNNTIGSLEQLEQQNYGASFSFSPKSNAQTAAITGEFNYFSNAFLGNSNTPVGYQMLEGLQPGKNFTWNLIVQKKLTKFLDLNLNYFGRKTPTSRTIHTGNVQLKAYF